ncbi:MAG: exosortase/archaeosortase family protein [Deltaproteobacteria bacterium]
MSTERDKGVLPEDLSRVGSEGGAVLASREEYAGAREWFLLVVAAIAFLGVFTPTMLWLYERWSLGIWYHSHGFLIPPVSVYFAWQIIKNFPKDEKSSPSPIGFFFLIPAIVAHVADTALQSYMLSSIALIFAIIGLALLLLGVNRTKALWFPIVFLFFMLPVPLVATEEFRNALRLITAIANENIMGLVGEPVYREGTLLYTSEGPVQIADACSGFSTLLGMITISSIYAYTSASGLREGLILVLISIPISVIANIIRVFIIIELCIYLGFGILDTTAHPASGVFAFVLGIIFLTVFHRVAYRDKG